MNRIAYSGEQQVRKVQMQKLDDLVAGLDSVMMKVDVEGAELEVLLGAERALANPSLIVIELETVVAESAAVVTRMEFESNCYDPFRRILSRQTNCRSSNTLFVRDWSFVAERLQSARQFEILG